MFTRNRIPPTQNIWDGSKPTVAPVSTMESLVRCSTPIAAPTDDATNIRPQKLREQGSEVVSLTCPTCGGKLQIANDIDRFSCGYCGNEHVVRRSGGIVSLQPLIQGIQRVQQGTDKTAAELAIRRLTEEIGEANQKILKIRARKSETPISERLTVVGAIVALISAGATGYAGLVVAVLLLALFFYFRVTNLRKESVIRNAELESLTVHVDELQQALEQNRRIVRT